MVLQATTSMMAAFVNNWVAGAFANMVITLSTLTIFYAKFSGQLPLGTLSVGS